MVVRSGQSGFCGLIGAVYSELRREVQDRPGKEQRDKQMRHKQSGTHRGSTRDTAVPGTVNCTRQREKRDPGIERAVLLLWCSNDVGSLMLSGVGNRHRFGKNGSNFVLLHQNETH